MTTYHIPTRFWDIPDKSHSKLTIGTDFRKIMFWTLLRWKIQRGIPRTGYPEYSDLKGVTTFPLVCDELCARNVVRKPRVIFEHYTKLTIGSDFRFFEFVGTKYTEFEHQYERRDSMFSILLGLVGGFPMICSSNQLIFLEKWFPFVITSPTVPKQQPALEDKTHFRLGRESLWFRYDRFEPKIALLSVNRSTRPQIRDFGLYESRDSDFWFFPTIKSFQQSVC